MHVIGDSLSAGITSEQEHLWPNRLASEWHVPVRNHAQAGATTASAFRQAEEIECDDCLVLIEIGGNDLLSGRDPRQIETDLDRLLTRLHAPRRTLLMFELPVPPIPGGYEFARLQRRLAYRHAVRLIPRREFARVLLTPGATTDSLHLSLIGHRALARLVLNTLSPLKRCVSSSRRTAPTLFPARLANPKTLIKRCDKAQSRSSKCCESKAGRRWNPASSRRALSRT